jgi:hypothetical protein
MAHRYSADTPLSVVLEKLRVPTSSTVLALQPLASPTTLAGLDYLIYLHYPHAEAFGMPVPSIHCTLIYSTSELFDRLLCRAGRAGPSVRPPKTLKVHAL